MSAIQQCRYTNSSVNSVNVPSRSATVSNPRTISWSSGPECLYKGESIRLEEPREQFFPPSYSYKKDTVIYFGFYGRKTHWFGLFFYTCYLSETSRASDQTILSKGHIHLHMVEYAKWRLLPLERHSSLVFDSWIYWEFMRIQPTRTKSTETEETARRSISYQHRWLVGSPELKRRITVFVYSFTHPVTRQEHTRIHELVHAHARTQTHAAP